MKDSLQLERIEASLSIGKLQVDEQGDEIVIHLGHHMVSSPCKEVSESMTVSSGSIPASGSNQ